METSRGGPPLSAQILISISNIHIMELMDLKCFVVDFDTHMSLTHSQRGMHLHISL